MKILILASGKSFHATRWANSLAARGLDIIFVTSHKLIRPLNENINFVQLSTRGSLGYILDVYKLKKIINELKPDILHIHYATGYGLMGKLTCFHRRIVSIYGSDIYNFPNKSFLHKKILEFNLSKATAILSTSNNMADKYIEIYKNKERPLITPFGVDLNIFKQLNHNNESSIINIGIVKKLEYIYGIDILLKAFHLLCHMNINKEVKLHIVGFGSMDNELKQLAKRLKIDDKVIFYGLIQNDKLPEFLTKLDIFVVPSRFESFGVAAVEAQACGLPVIVSNVGGLPEVVENNVTGLVVENENIELFAESMKTLIQDEKLRKQFSKNAIDRVKKYYDWEKNLDLMIEIYERILINDKK